MESATLHNDAITLSAGENVYQLQAGTRYFCIQSRTAVDFRLAFVTGKVAGPTDPYLTVFGSQGQTFSSPFQIVPKPALADENAGLGLKLYLAGAVGQVLEIYYG